MRLAGKISIITGAARGIGAPLVSALGGVQGTPPFKEWKRDFEGRDLELGGRHGKCQSVLVRALSFCLSSPDGSGVFRPGGMPDLPTYYVEAALADLAPSARRALTAPCTPPCRR